MAFEPAQKGREPVAPRLRRSADSTKTLVLMLVALPVISSAADSIADALAEGRFAEVLRSTESLIRSRPRDARVWTARGFALAGLGRDRESLATFDRALKLQPAFLAALRGASEVAYKMRDPRATIYLQKLLALEPGSDTAHAMSAVIAYETGDCEGAIAHFQVARAPVESDARASAQIGRCLIEAGKAAEATSLFSGQLARGSDELMARHNLGLAQMRAGAPAEAIATLEPVLDRADSDTLNLLAAAYSANAQIDKAIGALKRAAKIAPEDERNYLDLAMLCAEHNSVPLAFEFLNAGLERLPGSARLRATRGVLRAQSGEFENAQADLEAAGRLDPAGQYATSGLSVLLRETGRTEESIAMVRARQTRAPDDPALNYLLADLLLREAIMPSQREFQQARTALLRSLRVRPNFAPAHALLGKLYLREDNAERALEELRTALRLQPSNRAAMNQMALALRRLGRPEESRAMAERLRRQYEEDLKAESARARVRIEKQ